MKTTKKHKKKVIGSKTKKVKEPTMTPMSSPGTPMYKKGGITKSKNK